MAELEVHASIKHGESARWNMSHGGIGGAGFIKQGKTCALNRRSGVFGTFSASE